MQNCKLKSSVSSSPACQLIYLASPSLTVGHVVFILSWCFRSIGMASAIYREKLATVQQTMENELELESTV